LNIVVDLGGVVFTWDPDSIIAAVFVDPETRQRVRALIFDHPDWLELDRGTLELDEAIHRGAVRTAMPQAEIERLMRSVPQSLVPIPKTLEILRRIKEKGHDLFYLSNMHEASINHMEKQYSLWNIFDGGLISCRVHLVKPELGMFERLIQRFRLDVRQTVFIDDDKENLEAAATIGMRAIRFRDPQQLENDLSALGCM